MSVVWRDDRDGFARQRDALRLDVGPGSRALRERLALEQHRRRVIATRAAVAGVVVSWSLVVVVALTGWPS